MNLSNAADFATYYTDAKVATLQAAFNRVAPTPNWKTAIDVEIEASIAEIGDIKEAITFFTGSIARVTLGLGALKGGDGSEMIVRVRVRAAGYYAAIGA